MEDIFTAIKRAEKDYVVRSDDEPQDDMNYRGKRETKTAPNGTKRGGNEGNPLTYKKMSLGSPTDFEFDNMRVVNTGPLYQNLSTKSKANTVGGTTGFQKNRGIKSKDELLDEAAHDYIDKDPSTSNDFGPEIFKQAQPQPQLQPRPTAAQTMKPKPTVEKHGGEKSAASGGNINQTMKPPKQQTQPTGLGDTKTTSSKRTAPQPQAQIGGGGFKKKAQPEKIGNPSPPQVAKKKNAQAQQPAIKVMTSGDQFIKPNFDSSEEEIEDLTGGNEGLGSDEDQMDVYQYEVNDMKPHVEYNQREVKETTQVKQAPRAQPAKPPSSQPQGRPSKNDKPPVKATQPQPRSNSNQREKPQSTATKQPNASATKPAPASKQKPTATTAKPTVQAPNLPKTKKFKSQHESEGESADDLKMMEDGLQNKPNGIKEDKNYFDDDFEDIDDFEEQERRAIEKAKNDAAQKAVTNNPNSLVETTKFGRPPSGKRPQSGTEKSTSQAQTKEKSQPSNSEMTSIPPQKKPPTSAQSALSSRNQLSRENSSKSVKSNVPPLADVSSCPEINFPPDTNPIALELIKRLNKAISYNEPEGGSDEPVRVGSGKAVPLNLRFKDIKKDGYRSFEGVTLTSTILNIDLDELSYCYAMAVIQHLKHYKEIEHLADDEEVHEEEEFDSSIDMMQKQLQKKIDSDKEDGDNAIDMENVTESGVKLEDSVGRASLVIEL